MKKIEDIQRNIKQQVRMCYIASHPDCEKLLDILSKCDDIMEESKIDYFAVEFPVWQNAYFKIAILADYEHGCRDEMWETATEEEREAHVFTEYYFVSGKYWLHIPHDLILILSVMR